MPEHVLNPIDRAVMTKLERVANDEIAAAVMSLFGHLIALKTPVVVGGGEYVLPFYRAMATWAEDNGVDLSRGAEPHVVNFDEPST